MIKNIIFDFDGVLCESVNIKTEAFYEMYSSYGEDIANQVKQYHLKNGGMPRQDKFKYFENNLLHKLVTADRIHQLSEIFSSLVMTKVVNAPLVAGVQEFITMDSFHYKCFIVSATPHDEIKSIVQQKELQQYFKGIYGSPVSKIEWCQKILDEFVLNPSETVFIGDASSDFRAAKENHTHFILRKTEDNKKLMHQCTYKMDNLIDLDLYLKDNF